MHEGEGGGGEEEIGGWVLGYRHRSTFQLEPRWNAEAPDRLPQLRGPNYSQTIRPEKAAGNRRGLINTRRRRREFKDGDFKPRKYVTHTRTHQRRITAHLGNHQPRQRTAERNSPCLLVYKEEGWTGTNHH